MVTPTETPLLDEEVDLSILDEVDEDEDEFVSERMAALREQWPKPTEGDIDEARTELRSEWQLFHNGDGEAGEGTFADPDFYGRKGLAHIRDMRYQRDRMPSWYADKLSGPYRVRTRKTHNEILRATALATRNPPKVRIDPESATEKALKAATKEQRWAQELFPYLERRARKPLLRVFADGLFEGGIGLWEIYNTGTFDDLDLEEQFDGESDADFNKRTEAEMQSAGFPLGARPVDMMTAYFDEDEFGGVETFMSIQKQSVRRVKHQLRKKLSHDQIDKLMKPRPGDRGIPVDQTSQGTGTMAETIRYYDPVWYVYMVNGEIIEAVEHGFPSTPIIPAWGATTSSSNRDEQHQGIVWGMIDVEQALNDMLTIDIDIAATFNRPKAVIETDAELGRLRDDSGAPTVINLSGDGAVELMPGQKIVNAFEGFQSQVNPQTLGLLSQIWQENGMNPVAQGESPGADPAGFTINTLMQASQMLYEILLDNYARGIGSVIDFMRQSVKHTIKDTVYLSVHTEGHVEWLGLGPEDITDTPSEVVVDPLNDVNRLAIRDSLIAGHRGGYIEKRRVQAEGYGIEDTEAEDAAIAIGRKNEEMIDMAWADAKARIAMSDGAELMAMLGLGGETAGTPGPPGADDDAVAALDQTGGQPAPPQENTVGRDLSNATSATQRSAAANTGRAGGGQPGNQRPS